MTQFLIRFNIIDKIINIPSVLLSQKLKIETFRGHLIIHFYDKNIHQGGTIT